ncbi:MAG: hypothetical protein F4X14_04225 [Caldilineaceae bacterium SB0661_bin_32]|uniref:RiboL-PSP-HEPN domain-containing protein n=1 Tax=Caldilineaceae bacterium SB0661_bin_32 TaxID=2605255 RepID=A0A6B1D3J0_9CHLR|nr:hypothetical protein [Caldilineaceae bacterium SB0661_bin_32]
MASTAALNYLTAAVRVRTLREAATDGRLPRKIQTEKQVFYHAALAGYVAAWDAYINNLVRAFYIEIEEPRNTNFQAVYSISRQASERALDRFNTPNAENTRALLQLYTGYDPIGDWVWTRRGMVGVQVRERLNEILRVRHSFAHGFAVPGYDWTQSPSGQVRLTSKVIRDTEAFFNNLVRVTDNGMRKHIQLTFGIAIAWH